MDYMPFRKRAAQVLGLMVMAAGLLPILFGLSVLTGALTFNFGQIGAPVSFWVMVLGAAPVGVLIVWVGKRLVSWGMRMDPGKNADE